jgi:hypothetical protein
VDENTTIAAFLCLRLNEFTLGAHHVTAADLLCGSISICNPFLHRFQRQFQRRFADVALFLQSYIDPDRGQFLLVGLGDS